MSGKIEYDAGGNPTFAILKRAGALITTEPPAKKPTQAKPESELPTEFEGVSISPWGANNDWPTETADAYLKKSTVLRSAIEYKIRLAMGQGIFAAKVNGYDKEGNEQIEPLNRPEINRFLSSRMIRRYMYKALDNMYRYGAAFPEMIINKKGDKIAAINVQDSPFCRLSEVKDGVIKWCVISGNWPNPKTEKKDKDWEAVPVLDLMDGQAAIRARVKKLKKFIYPLNIPVSGSVYYPLPAWDTARQSKWLDIAGKVPEYLDAIFDNQMAIKYHIRIPYAYWDKVYPRSEYKDEKTRQELISAKLDELEEEMTKAENARKAIITHFEINQMGKAEEKWEIDVIDDKFRDGQYLPQSAAANSEVLFSMSVNPSVKGAGMPGGPYAGNAGSGSDIREAFLVDIASCWNDRQEILDPIELMLRMNYDLSDDVELRFRNTILITLDKGKGTQKEVS